MKMMRKFNVIYAHPLQLAKKRLTVFRSYIDLPRFSLLQLLPSYAPLSWHATLHLLPQRQVRAPPSYCGEDRVRSKLWIRINSIARA